MAQIETKTTEKFNIAGWPVYIGWAAMLIFTIYSCTYMVAAGDTWVAMACGRHFVNHGVDTVEPFSANSHSAGPTAEDIEEHWPGWAQRIVDTVGLETVQKWHPTGWINQNWLTQVIFYRLTTTLGSETEPYYDVLVWWKFAIYIITIICVYFTARLIGVNQLLAAVFACFALYVGRTFLDIRPAGFSNMLVAVYLLILTLATHRNIKYIWLLVPVTVFWANVHGGYLYAFIMMIPFAGVHLAIFLANKYTPSLGKKFVTIGIKGIYHTIAAGAVMLIAAIVFNPYHFTNFTHTFIISVSEHAEMWRTVNEWHPAFAWDNPVGSPYPFLVMFILAFFLLGWWLISVGLSRTAYKHAIPPKKLRKIGSTDWIFFSKEFPQVDITLFVISAMTIYMAVRSRRFIPIAAIAAAPVLSLMLQQGIQAIAAVKNFRIKGKLEPPPMPEKTAKALIFSGTAILLVLTAFWTVKFNQVYFGSWLNERGFNSIFMRMTASDSKPFFAMQFIRENGFEGKMYNYWTEGGFIAWGQTPDEETSKTPLQLFMDGRAQAAYEPHNYQRWAHIYSGGPAVNAILRRRGSLQNMDRSDYLEIGQWIDEQLKSEDAWVVLMPSTEFNSTFVRAMEALPNWRKVFFNTKQRLYVDLDDTRGEQMYVKAVQGQLTYPNSFSENMMKSKIQYNHGQTLADRQEGLVHAIEAFDEKPSGEAMQQVLLAGNFQEMQVQAESFTAEYIEQLENNLPDWLYRDGGYDRMVAGIYAANYLANLAGNRQDTESAQRYVQKIQKYRENLEYITNRKRW